MTDGLVEKLASELEQLTELYINGDYCHMGIWFDDGWLTDNNILFESPAAAVKYALDTVGKYLGHAQTELEYDIDNE